MEGTGVEWSGGEGREGGGAGQGRVTDCLGGLSRVGISSRYTRPWNGQPPSVHYEYVFIKNIYDKECLIYIKYANNNFSSKLLVL